jgi:hypothetical protein
MVQFDQTTICVTPRIVCKEEVGQSLQGPVRFIVRVRLQRGNYLDCSSGTISARRRGLGLFKVAQLTQHRDKHVQMLHDPICEIAESRSAPNSIRQFTAHHSKEGRFMKKEGRTEIERRILSRVKREMNKPRLTESVRNGFSAPLGAPSAEKPAARPARV